MAVILFLKNLVMDNYEKNLYNSEWENNEQFLK